MPRLASCKGCGKKLHPHEKFTHSSKSYCDVCYKKVTRDSNEYKQLVEFICDNYKIEKPTGLMFKQIKDMKIENGYSYGGMTYTLWYCKEILMKQLNVKYGVTLIKFYYDEAKNYYNEQERLIKQLNELEDIELKTKVIKINKQTGNSTTNKSLINLNDLLGGN
ncbi:hypothetical protein KQI61_05885 [Anaerocolumna aminovalerica]|uniref:hypothetical protein n=1 Tax=Anaerocolumna aminovalerica TaxID=1527 RepID=UPI001C0F14AF|nr:hypothetical protein [Anaerocolumna aminovalerica]MBU5331720.1 hypothetical protein [Anaerocolumna aminovalerica]